MHKRHTMAERNSFSFFDAISSVRNMYSVQQINGENVLPVLLAVPC